MRLNCKIILMVCLASILAIIFIMVSVGQLENSTPKSEKIIPDQLVLQKTKEIKSTVKKSSDKEYHFTTMVTSAKHLTQIIISANESGVDGQITSFKNLGDHVKKDEEVINCGYPKGKQLELSTVLNKAKIQRDIAKMAMERALIEKHRTLTLKKNISDGISASDFDNIVLAFTRSQLDLKSAEHDIVIADQRSSPYEFSSMIDGEIISIGKFVKKGFIITKYYGEPIELMRIADLSQLEVTIIVPYTIKHQIESFTVICQGDSKKEKRKSWISNLEEKNGILNLTLCFENPSKHLRPFEAADVIAKLRK